MPCPARAKNPRSNTNEVSKRLILEDLDEKRKSKSVNFVFHDPQPPSTKSAVAVVATPATPSKFKSRSEVSQILQRRTSPRLQSKYNSQPRPNYRIESGSEFEHSEYEDHEDISGDEEDEDTHSNSPNFGTEYDEDSDSEAGSCENSSLNSEESMDGDDSEESEVICSVPEASDNSDTEHHGSENRAPTNFQIKLKTALGDKPDKRNWKDKRDPNFQTSTNMNSGPVGKTSRGVELLGDENRSQPVINKTRTKMSTIQHPNSNSKKGKERQNDIQFQVVIPVKGQKLQRSVHQPSSSKQWCRREYQKIETQENSDQNQHQYEKHRKRHHHDHQLSAKLIMTRRLRLLRAKLL